MTSSSSAARPPARVTIGMPAYNSSATIELAIESLLAQTFRDFELVVSDNASADRTCDIVENYAAKDSRVRLVRQKTNIGANFNYAFVAKQARGEYFKWASSNDWCAPTMLERCVAQLDQQPEATLAHTYTRLFSQTIDDATDYVNSLSLIEPEPSSRFVRLVQTMRLNNAMNGVMRVAALRQAGDVRPHFGGDNVFMGRLALLGKFLEVPEYLFYRQMNEATATALRSLEEFTKHHYPTRTVRELFQNWKLQAEWIRAPLEVSIPWNERRRVLAYACRMAFWSRQRLWRDIADVPRFFLRKGRA